MRGGRPRTAIGTYGTVNVRKLGRCYLAETRYRDVDGRLRRVTARCASRTGAVASLKERLARRPGHPVGSLLSPASGFGELADLWLIDLEGRDISEGTKVEYRNVLRLHVRPAMEHYTLGEITTGRVEWFLKAERAVSYSRARMSRTILNQLFRYALRQDAIGRNPVEGTSPLAKPKGKPQALSLEQIATIRKAAAAWRTGEGVLGPRPDGQVRDLIEVLLGTGLRPGEALALRLCDIEDGPRGMSIRVTGTVIQRKGQPIIRQPYPKTPTSNRGVPVPEFAAAVLRSRVAGRDRRSTETVFVSKQGGPLRPCNVRRTFRDFLKDARLSDSGISLRWYRRTAATVIARGIGADAAASLLGHASTAITQGHYIEPDRTVDFAPAQILERTLRADHPDRRLLSAPGDDEEELILDVIDATDDEEEATTYAS